MPLTKYVLLPVTISLVTLLWLPSCTCSYEFTYHGQILDAQDSQPAIGAEIWTPWYDLYAIDPEKNNKSAWGEPAVTDTFGYYRLPTSGLYDCGPGRPDIDDPGDLGWIYFHIEKEGYLPLDTAFQGSGLSGSGEVWYIPTLLLRQPDSTTVPDGHSE